MNWSRSVRAPGPDHRADAHRMDDGEPRRLLQHHGEIVLVLELHHVVAPPAKLHRLPFGGLSRHALGVEEDVERELRAEGLPVVEERTQAQEKHRVAGVQRERNAVERMERGLAAPHFALVLDVVMNEEGVVQKLDRHGRAHRVGRARPERARGRDADARAHHLSAAPRIVGREVVEVGTGFAGRQIGLHGAPELRAGTPRGVRLRAAESPGRNDSSGPRLYGFVSSRTRTLMKPAGS